MDSPAIAPLPALVRCTSCPTEVARDWLLRDGWMLREGYWFCGACLPASQWVVELDRARNAHQVTVLQLEHERHRVADLEQRLIAMTIAAAQANRDATAALERERIALALDRAARAITGKSAAEVNAELDLQVEAYPDEEIHDG